MAVESISIPLGALMPKFHLKDAGGKEYHSQEVMGDKALLVIFTCNHCPYALAIWPRLIQLAEEVKSVGVNALAINPNIHPDYPDDSPEMMLKKTEEWGIPFPYLVDETQNVAREFKAQCTPDIFLYDPDFRLVYHGRFDDNWKERDKVQKEELKIAIQSLAQGEEIPQNQIPSMGCSIKWL